MQIKKYIALTLKDAMDQLKNELGSEAVVLSTRVIPGEPDSKITKQYEVLAGIENSPEKKADKPKLFDKIIDDNTSDTIEELKNLKDKVFPRSERLKREMVIKKSVGEKPKIANIASRLKEIKEDLLVKEIYPSLTNKIIEQISGQVDFIKSNNLENHVVSTIASLLHTSNFEVKKKGNQKVVALVGPTGVGKTTCIAKLALISKIFHKLDIGIITLDTFRLGAIDQLKIFAEISNVDMLVCYEADDLPKILNKFKKKDLVFIDTAGRSQNNITTINEIKKSLAQLDINEIFLVLSSTSSTRNLLDVIKKFQPLKFNGLIFTKLDEAAAFGSILNVCSKVEVPIKFLTNGQVIPDDIIAADDEFIAKMIYNGSIS
jgi:flagellar biosynthesis protein FlhF